MKDFKLIGDITFLKAFFNETNEHHLEAKKLIDLLNDNNCFIFVSKKTWKAIEEKITDKKLFERLKNVIALESITSPEENFDEIEDTILFAYLTTLTASIPVYLLTTLEYSDKKIQETIEKDGNNLPIVSIERRTFQNAINLINTS